MLKDMKRDVLEANLELVRRGLVVLTWGNASGIDRQRGLVVIKPSGVPYESMRRQDMAVVDLDGELVEGPCKPSVDTQAHLVLYKAFSEIGAVVHTHSHYAACWAQAGRPIPCLGTTHADLAYGEIPVTDALTAGEVAHDYERHIGEVIVRRYQGLDPLHYPAVLAAQHAPFTWGKTLPEAVETAIALEETARMAYHTLMLNPNTSPIPQYLLDKHFLRKHGPAAYYGQDQDTHK